MIKTNDIYWLAGLIEGEGCFYLMKNKQYLKHGYPILTLSMTDLDIMERASGILGAHVSRPQKTPSQFQYRITIAGCLAIQWAMTLYPIMGLRRKEKIINLISAWKQFLKLKNTMCKNHPNKKHLALGLCQTCYQRHYRQKNK